jgi:hypothetical protein
VFFRNYSTEIKDGRLIVSVPEVLTLNLPMDETDKVQPIVKMKTSTKYLKQAINEVSGDRFLTRVADTCPLGQIAYLAL